MRPMSALSPRDFESLGARLVRGQGALGLDAHLLHALLDQLPVRCTIVGRDLRYRFANQAFLEAMGLRLDQVLNQPARAVLGEAVFSTYLPAAERVFAGEALRWRGWIDYGSAHTRYFEQHLLPYASGGTEIDAMLAFGRDITDLEQRDAELAATTRALSTTEALKSAIVDHALAALVSTDAEGRIVEFNPAAEAMFGLRRALVLGHSVEEVIIPPQHRAAHHAGMARLAAGEPARLLGRRMEMTALRADGREFPVEMVLWRTEVAGSSYYTASMVDLSARQEAEREIERQREALRQSEKLSAMGSLLAGVAHELNNPLAIVLGRATLLEEKTGAYPELQQDAQRIRNAAERCGRIVKTFLNMARARPGARTPVLLNELVRAAADLLSYTWRSHGLQLELLLAEDLPRVLADADQIGQLVLNLMVNAQQALSQQEGPRRVQVSTGLEALRPGRAPRVWLRVADNGPGVPEAARTRLFEPFFTTKSEGLGTGLGLAVSRALAREHGGELQLEPHSPLGGAAFRLSLPLTGQAEVVATHLEPASAAPPAARARVLVVDDEPEIAELARAMLEAAGYAVALADSGRSALARLAEQTFDAVVSDLRMPDMDGAALWRALGEQYPALRRRVLFVTGDTLSPGAQQFLDQTECPALDKPFTKAELLAKLAQLLG